MGTFIHAACTALLALAHGVAACMFFAEHNIAGAVAQGVAALIWVCVAVYRSTR